MLPNDPMADFELIYKSFDKDLILKNLTKLLEKNEFYEKHSTKLKYLVRKHSIEKNDMFISSIQNNIINEKLSEKTRINLVEALKFILLKNPIEINLGELIKIFQKSKFYSLKNEILKAIEIKLKSRTDQINKEELDELNKIIESIDENLSKESLDCICNELDEMKANYLKKSKHKSKPQQIEITKNIQKNIISTKHLNLNEKEHVSIDLKITNFVKNENKLLLNKSLSVRPALNDDDGSDVIWYKNTYDQLKYFSNKLNNNKYKFKKKDKNEYLPSKLMNNEAIYTIDFKYREFKLLLCHRLISEIFRKISNDQQLEQNTIDKLMECVVSTNEKIKCMMLGCNKENEETHRHDKSFYKNLNISLIFEPIDNETIRCIFDEIKKIFNECTHSKGKNYIDCEEHAEKLDKFITSLVINIRTDSIATICNCLLRNRSLFKDDYKDKLKQLLIKETDDKIISSIIDIFTYISDESADYKQLFDKSLQMIKTSNDLTVIQRFLIYINEQIKDRDRLIDLFESKENMIDDLISHCFRNDLNSEIKSNILKIVIECVKHQDIQYFSEDTLKKCLELLSKENNNNIKLDVLHAIYLSVDKQNSKLIDYLTTKDELAKSLLLLIADLDLYYIVLIILEKLFYLIHFEDLHKISNYLSNDSVILINKNNGEIYIEERSEENQAERSISSLTSNVILNKLRRTDLNSNIQIYKNYNFELLLKNLISATKSSPDFKTRLASSEAIHLLSKINFLVCDKADLLDLSSLILGEENDIRNYATLSFINLVKNFIDNEGINNKSKKELLEESFNNLCTSFTNDIILPENNNCPNEETRIKLIIKIFDYASQICEFNETVFDLFLYILELFETYQLDILKILEKYAKKNFLTHKLINVIENFVGTNEKDEIEKTAFNILIISAEKGQQVGEITLELLNDLLFQPAGHDDIVRILWIISETQNLPDKIFFILEMEKAVECINSCTTDNSNEMNNAFSFLIEQTNNGKLLTPKVFKELEKTISKYDKQVLTVILNAAKNEQNIPNEFVSKLEKLFHEKIDDYSEVVFKSLIEIFIKLNENNQQITKDFLNKLENAVLNPLDKFKNDYRFLYLFIITKLKENEGTISKELVKKIFENFTKNALKIEILSLLLPILIKNNLLNDDLVKNIINDCLEDDNSIELIRIMNNSKVDLTLFKQKITNIVEKENHNLNLIISELNEQKYNLKIIIEKLTKNLNWRDDQIWFLFEEIKKKINEKEEILRKEKFISLLELAYEYEIKSLYYSQILSIIRDQNSDDWAKKLNEIAISMHFSTNVEEKLLEELINELKNQNKPIESFIENLNLVEKIKKINSKELQSKIRDISKKKINQWSKEDILIWAKNIKQSNSYFKNQEFIIETLAVINRAIYLYYNYNLKSSQILSVILGIKLNEENKGRLEQVATGEGKSLIITVLAIYYVLNGNKVDIVTSSPVLAQREVRDKSKLYLDYFGLTCGCNNDKSIYIKGEKKCYKNDIVYGETSQFQFDFLRDKYSSLSTLADRKCDEIVIADEVDSLLLDDSSKIAKLSTSLPGTDLFQQIYIYLWQRLIYLVERVCKINEKWFFIEGKLGYDENNDLFVEVIKQENEIYNHYKIDINSNLENNEICEPLENSDLDEFLRKKLEDYLYQSIENKLLVYPNHFENFVKIQISKWVNSSIIAFRYYHENVHYIVNNGLIKPVDLTNTGIIQEQTNYSNGLHQFLQIKHGLKITPESLTTNYLSNMSFFKNYKKLIGFTGTLGSTKSQNVLKDVYKVDIVKVPELKKKKIWHLPILITQNTKDWLAKIKISIQTETKKNRGVLIICECIEHVLWIERLIKTEFRNSKIKCYTMNNMNQEKSIENISKGEIIIATNLAGRGTHIKTCDIDSNGGLHIILSFLPANKRVLDQNLGRTSRQGNPGTTQLIINMENEIKINQNMSFESIQNLIDQEETKLLDNFLENDKKIIELKDFLFKKFCDDLKEVKSKLRNIFFNNFKKDAISSWLKNKIISTKSKDLIYIFAFMKLLSYISIKIFLK